MRVTVANLNAVGWVPYALVLAVLPVRYVGVAVRAYMSIFACSFTRNLNQHTSPPTVSPLIARASDHERW